jgi:hypothetical protein
VDGGRRVQKWKTARESDGGEEEGDLSDIDLGNKSHLSQMSHYYLPKMSQSFRDDVDDSSARKQYDSSGPSCFFLSSSSFYMIIKEIPALMWICNVYIYSATLEKYTGTFFLFIDCRNERA